MIKKSLAIVMVGAVEAAVAIVVPKKRALPLLPPPESPPLPVLTATVYEGVVGSTVDTVALIVAKTATTVAAHVSGTLLEVRFREGDTVRQGEVMAQIDPRLLDDAVRAAKARVAATAEDLAKQQAICERDKVLYENQAISRQAFEMSAAQLAAVKAAHVVAEQALESAKTLRAYADVPAPFTGVVTSPLVEPGDLAVPGKPLYSLQVQGPVKLISKPSQENLQKLRPGDPVVFQALGHSLAAKTRAFTWLLMLTTWGPWKPSCQKHLLAYNLGPRSRPGTARL